MSPLPSSCRNPEESVLKPIIFLDFNGYDVFSPDPPEDLWRRLFHPPAIAVLQELVSEFAPKFVLTTSWLRLMNREGCDTILKQCGLSFISESLHEH